jgi:hypothetical protein
MADFYPVLKKAAGALPPGSGPDGRNALYEKARAALLRQLEAREPRLTEGEMMRQRLLLEEVIRRVEREADRADLETLEKLDEKAPTAPYPASQPAAKAKPQGKSIGPMVGIAAALAIALAGVGYMVLRPADELAPQTAEAPQQTPASPKPADPPAATQQTAAAAKPADPAAPSAGQNPDGTNPGFVAGSTETANKPAELAIKPAQEPETRTASLPAAQPAKEPEAAAQQPAAEAPAPETPAAAPAASAERPAAVEPPKPAAAIPVAVRASLYEPPAEAGGRATERRGALIWRKTTSSDKKTPAISGTFEFPDARLNAVLLIEKNNDPALPATHNLSLLFTPLEGATLGIREVLSIEMRDDLQKLGVRLDGVRAQPIENMVLIGLSSGAQSVGKNVPALREQPWIYVDLVFSDGRRGAMIFEKGAAGSKVFDEVFGNWGG